MTTETHDTDPTVIVAMAFAAILIGSAIVGAIALIYSIITTQ